MCLIVLRDTINCSLIDRVTIEQLNWPTRSDLLFIIVDTFQLGVRRCGALTTARFSR